MNQRRGREEKKVSSSRIHLRSSRFALRNARFLPYPFSGNCSSDLREKRILFSPVTQQSAERESESESERVRERERNK